MKKNGFTIVEVCISLFLILLFLILPIRAAKEAKEMIDAYRFLTEFEKLVKLHHQRAVLSSNEVKVIVSKQYVHFYYSKDSFLMYPKGISYAVSDSISIKFSQRTGTSNSTSTIRFLLPSNQYVSYTFKLGRGDYEKSIS